MTTWPWFDESVLELLSFWPPMLDRIPHSVVHFLLRRPESAHSKNDVYLHIWRCLPRTLSQGVLWSSRARGFLREELLTAMWSATSFNARSHKDRSALSILQAAHEALSSAHFSPTEAPITRSIVSVLEFKMLHAMPWSFTTVGEALLSITLPLFPADTAVDIPEEIRNKGEGEEFEENPIWLEFLWAKKSEASFCVVAEYLQHCTSSMPPYKAAETLKKIAVIATSTCGEDPPGASGAARGKHLRDFRGRAGLGTYGLPSSTVLCGILMQRDTRLRRI
ncbi:hypothetical protein C8R46DRAFT_253715 [Mycena filopes]|nr:hypothetical protein C8R46DRAFT_253715 [Mycena filopes]